MGNISEQPLSAKVATSLGRAIQQGLQLLGKAEHDDPKSIVEAIDTFADNWQQGKRPPKSIIEAEDAPFALGPAWGQQLVRQFRWEWAYTIMHDYKDAKLSGVVSPDRSLVIYPIHFLIGCLKDPTVDVTIALAYNILAAGKAGKMKPKEYFNLMNGVRRIVPRR